MNRTTWFDKDTTVAWVIARWVIAISVAAFIVAAAVSVAVGGSHNNMNAGVGLGIVLALAPAGIYACCARSRSSIMFTGVVLIGATGIAWTLFLVNRTDALAGAVFIPPSFVITLLASCLAAIHDNKLR